MRKTLNKIKTTPKTAFVSYRYFRSSLSFSRWQAVLAAFRTLKVVWIGKWSGL